MLDIRIYVVHAPNERQVGRVWKDIYHCQCADPACHSINNHPYSCYTLHRGVQAFDAAAKVGIKAEILMILVITNVPMPTLNGRMQIISCTLIHRYYIKLQQC